MSLKKIAEQIPAEYRKEMLELDMIDKAVAQAGDATMHYLATIWKNYIEPDFTGECNLCLGRVLDNFKAMKKTLVEMEKNSQLLNQV